MDTTFKFPMQIWKDRVALVTGASSGIGHAIASSLLEHGMRVATCGLRKSKLDALGANAPSSHYLPIKTNLRDKSQIEALFQQIRQKWGGVDVLVNNAGIGHLAPLISGETELWREMLEVNILALCVCTREAIQDMRRRGNDDGYIIHVSSIDAHIVPPDGAVYSASKVAVRALTIALREELHHLKSHIRVTAISPGRTETNFLSTYLKSKEKAQTAYNEYKTLQPEDIARTVIYLLSQPKHIQFQDLIVYPIRQPSFTRTSESTFT